MWNVLLGVTVTGRDYYEFLGLEQKLRLDPAELQRRFYELSRQWHPDRHAAGPAAQQQQALENTALLNDAFRTLREPVRRAEYVLNRHGLVAGEHRAKDVPQDLLEEVFELNMALDEIRSGDAAARPQLEKARAGFAGLLAGIDSDLDRLFGQWDETHSSQVLQQIRGTLNRRKYISNLVQTVDQTLAANEHEHAAN